MNINKIIEKSFDHGVSLFVKEGKLKVRFNKGDFPDELKLLIGNNKDEIIEYLTQSGIGRDDSSTSTEVIPLRGDLQQIPLSWAQQRLWFIAQLEGGNAAYHIPGAVRLMGELSHDALEQALDTIVIRHEVLRTVFKEDDGYAYQEIQSIEASKFDLAHRDISDAENIEMVLQEESEQFNLKSFDLMNGPLIRGLLLQLSEQEHVLLINMHHIISDGWSMGVLVGEFTTLYEAYRLDKPNPLPALPIQYADYAVWQRDKLSGDVLAKQSAYWLKHLADAPELLNLPTDRQRPTVQSYNGGTVFVELNPEVTKKIKALASSQGMTVHMVLHAVWSVLLSRLSGQNQIVVGTPVANRQRQEIEGLIGFFVNTLALRVDLSEDLSVKEVLSQVKSVTLVGYANQDVPFEQVVELIKPERSLSYSPVFQAMFNFMQDNAEKGEGDLNLSGISADTVAVESEAKAQFDLTISLSDAVEYTEDGNNIELIIGNIEYASDLFDEETIQRWSEYFSRLAEEFADNTDVSINKLSMLSESERCQLLETNNDTVLDLPSVSSIHELFETQVIKNPDSTALEFHDQCLTYQELNDQANQLAHELIAQGVKSGDFIGLYLPRSINIFVSMLGVMKAGAAYVMLDTQQPIERLKGFSEHADLRFLLSDCAHKEQCESINNVSKLYLDEEVTKENLSNQSHENPNVQTSADAAALVYLTSGSTGKPKGAINSHMGIVNTMWAMSKELALTPSDRVLQFASLSFDVVIEEIFPAWFSGAAVVIRDEEGLLAPDQLQLMLERLEITVCELMASYWSLWVSYLSDNKMQPPEHFRTLILGSDAVLMPAYNTWQEYNIPIVNVFGLTETGCTTLTYKAQGPQNYESRLPNGRPLANTKVYILDKVGNPVPQGVMGELCIAGLGVGLGYLGEAELTAEQFVDNPFGEGLMYKTGDLARWLQGGLVEFIGRGDHQVKLRGFRIELGEIESQLRNQSMIRDAVVIFEKAENTEGLLIAYVTVNDELDQDSLRKKLSASLPEYMVPHIYIELEDMPLTANGKIDRKSLPKVDDEHMPNAQYEAPESETEVIMAEIWQELLNVERISRHDNFFKLGGHSLLAIRLGSLVQKRLKKSLNLQTLFERPVLKDLSEALDEIKQAYLAPITMADRTQPLPLSWAQQRLWFIAQLEGGNAAYHLPEAVQFGGEISRDALEQAFVTIIERHEALRTVFKEVDGDVWQEIVPSEDFKFALAFKDLRNVENQQVDMGIVSQTFNQMPFDLTAGPLIRGLLVQLAEHEHVLLVVMHHIVSDAWSMNVMVQEFTALYDAYSSGKPEPVFPELPIQYADYAVWQRNELSGDVLTQQSDYWVEHLAEAPELLTLPTDHPRPSMPSYEGGYVGVELDPEISQKIKAIALSQGVTEHMVMHAVWCILLSRLSGQDQIVVGTPVANRQRHEVEGLIGFFVNTLAIRMDLSGNLTVKDVLRQVKTITLDGYANQDIPFEQVVELVQPTRNLSYTPVFQAMFNFEKNDIEEDLDLSDVSANDVAVKSDRKAQFDIILSLTNIVGDNGDGEYAEIIAGGLEYASDLFDDETIVRWSKYFNRLTAEFVADLDAPINELPMLSEAEHHQLIESNNDNAAELPSVASIHELFEAQVDKYPESIALAFNDKALTYQALNNQANQLAHELINQGVKAGDFVGLYLPRSLDIFISMLGVMKAGAAYVMLDTQQPNDRLKGISEQANLRLVLSDCAHKEQCDAIFGVSKLYLDEQLIKESLSNNLHENPNIELPENAPALVYVTSGSTGIPKGAINSHMGIVNTMWAMSKELELTPSDRVLQFASLSFDVVIEEIFPAWFSGAAVVIRDEEGLMGPEQLQSMLERLEITVCELMASYWSLWVNYLQDNNIPPAKSLRTLILGSDAVLMPAYNKWQAYDIPIVNVFGLTETGCTTLSYKAHGEQDYANHLPNGRPLANTKVYILDQVGNPVPQGVMGELCIGGLGVGIGYVGESDLTAERFVDNPFDQGLMYKTGDLARWLPDGLVEFIGRGDHQVKLRGFRIELGEIEAQLHNQKVIDEAVVIFDKHDENTEGRLVAYITVNDELDEDSLRKDLSGSLPEYMVPQFYIEMESMPLTVNGKVDRKALPKPEGHHLSQAEYEAPFGDTEIILAEVWQNLLKTEKVSRHDNFFKLGGHSLLIIRLIAELQAKDLVATVRMVFENPVLKDLAHEINASEKTSFQAPPNLIPHDCDYITPDLLTLVSLEQSHIDKLVEQIPGGAANIQDIYPLGPLQEGVLFHHMLASPEIGDTYLVPSTFRLPNQQQADRLIDILNHQISRHDVFRTAVFWDGLPLPVQVVLRESTINVNELTLDASRDVMVQLDEHIAPNNLWIDLGQAPLLRIDMASDPNTDEVYVILYEHHIINDHIGLENLIEEVCTYSFQDNGEALNIPDLPAVVPYREFIAHTLMLAESGATQAYFESRFSDVDEPTAPFGVYDTQVGAKSIHEFHCHFDETICGQIRDICSQLNISAASMFHLAWALVIGRCSDRDDVIFGSVLSGRLQGSKGAERSVGLFINTLPLRLSLSGTIGDSLKQAHIELLNLIEHEQASLAQVQACTGLANDAPLFTSLLNYRRGELPTDNDMEATDDDMVDDELELDISEISGHERSNYPLGLSINDFSGKQFGMSLQSIDEIDGERLMGYMFTAVKALVGSTLDNADINLNTPLSEVNIFPEQEHQHLLIDLNQTQADYPDTALIHELFEDHVKTNPDAIAVVFEQQSLSYNELNQRANQLAHYLIEQGVKPDTLVGLCLERSLEMMIGLLGILKAGGAYVPMDPTYPEARLTYQIKDADLNFIITQESLQTFITSISSVKPLCLDNDEMIELLQDFSNRNVSASKLGLHSNHLAYVIYTSGTTGVPKGVMIEHQGLCNLTTIQEKNLQVSSSSHILQFASIAFDAATWDIFMALAQGGVLVMLNKDQVKSSDSLETVVQQQGVTHATLPPALLPVLNVEQWQSVGTIIVAGESCPENSALLWSQGRTFVNGYGPSETTICATTGVFNSPVSKLHIGGPNCNTQVYVCDRHNNLLPKGVMGELLVGGVGLARGYLNQEELTAEKFIANPFYDASDASSSKRLYKTGDLVRWLDDDKLEFVGRVDQQVKLRGFRIELGEIEELLLSQEFVQSAVVVLENINDNKLLVAYIVSVDETELDSQLLRQNLSASLPDYMVPAIYMQLDAIPLTSNGKVDHKALPKPDGKNISQVEYEPPQSDTEIALAEIWQELLNVERVGRHDNFFNLGGHSLLAIKLVNLVNDKFNFHMQLKLLFEINDLQQLAEYIDTFSISEDDTRDVIEF